jgi:hypothetical protein
MDVLGRNEFRKARNQRKKGDLVSLTWQSQMSLADEGGRKALPVNGSRWIDTCSPVPAARLAAVGDAFAARLDLTAIAQPVDQLAQPGEITP